MDGKMFVEIIVRQLLERTTTNKITISNLMYLYHMGLFFGPFQGEKENSEKGNERNKT